MKRLTWIIVLLAGYFNLMAQQDPNSLQTQSNLAINYYNAKDYEKAIPLLYNVYQITKNSTYFKYYLDCMIQEQRFTEAGFQIQKEIEKQSPENPEFYIHWGYILKIQKKTDEANEKFRKAIERIEPNKGSYLITANAFLGWSEFELALETYKLGQKALAPEPFNYELARAYMYLRDYDKMMDEYLEMAKQSEKQLPLIQSNLSSALRLDIEGELLENFKTQVLKRIQSEPEVIAYNRLLIWFFLQENKFPGALRQSIALDRRTGQEDMQIIQLGHMALNNEKYADAKNAFDYLLGKGEQNPLYTQSYALNIHASYLQYINETPDDIPKGMLLAELFDRGLTYLGFGAPTLNLIQENAHLLAFYLNKTEKAIEILNRGLEIPQLNSEQSGMLKAEMADIYVYANDPWEATLLYSQVIDVNKANSLGDEVKLKKAKLGYYLGNFSWAKAQLDVLKASTSKLTANDAMELSLLIGNNLNLDTTAAPLQMFARADLLFFQNKNQKAMATLDSLMELYPYHMLVDDILFRKAKIEIEEKKYAKASEYLQKICDDFSYELLGDDALFLLAGLLNNQLNEKEKAKELYREMLTRHPGSIYIEDSRNLYRELRQMYPDKIEPLKQDPLQTPLENEFE